MRVGGGLAGLLERGERSILLSLSDRRSIGRLATRLPLTRRMVGRFVAGESLPAALPALERARDAGFKTTVDVLGESVTSIEAARASAESYIATLPVLAERSLDLNVSLKLSQMGLGLGAEIARENLARVLLAAADLGAFVRIDMEDHTTTDATLDLWRQVRPVMAGSGDVGVVIQSALRRSESDVEGLVEAGARIRLCKGAYKEPASVAYADKADVDAAYVRLMERLLLEADRPAIATHDERIIDHAIRFVRNHDIAPAAFEFQMLFGVRRDLQDRLRSEGWQVRIYVPLGSEWYPYFMRRLAERPANVMFVIRSLLRERRGSER